MVAALLGLAKTLGWHPSLKNVWVWVDYGCIPQACPSTQSLAIRSLAAYASSATYFVVCAPPVPHADTSDLCTLSTYQMRMWCRAEQVCHSMRNGKSENTRDAAALRSCAWLDGSSGGPSLPPFSNTHVRRVPANSHIVQAPATCTSPPRRRRPGK